MFRLYLECGSVGALAEELGRRNIASKVRTFASGRSKGGGRYSIGALAHFLKNRKQTERQNPANANTLSSKKRPAS